MYTYGSSQKKLGTDSIQAEFGILFSSYVCILLYVLDTTSLNGKFIFARSSFLTKQK